MSPSSPHHRMHHIINQLLINHTASATTPTGSSNNTGSNSSNLQLGSYTCILVEVQGRVGIVTLNRPNALNALNDTIISEVSDAFTRFDHPESGIGCIILTGSGDKSFAAGADIKEMAPQGFIDQFNKSTTERWEKIANIRIPTIAAVNGFAFGGGCEIAMMCDIILASDRAKFGQPEIKLGIIPGAGGTQRLTRIVGKSKAMELVLTGNMWTAEQAYNANLVSRVIPHNDLMSEALKLANQISSLSLPAVKIAKASVKSAYETTLAQGMVNERIYFQQTFALKDKMIGTKAFIEKKKPQWEHK